MPAQPAILDRRMDDGARNHRGDHHHCTYFLGKPSFQGCKSALADGIRGSWIADNTAWQADRRLRRMGFETEIITSCGAR